METPKKLAKALPGGIWRSQDGLEIPRAGSPARKRWDRAFAQKTKEHFGPGELIEIDLDKTVASNMPHNGARVDLYRKMAAEENGLPPPVVEPLGNPEDGRWYVKDGNHRIEGAKQAGKKTLLALNVRPVTKSDRLKTLRKAAEALLALKR
jgi:uncharacterized ParB-like nuclease family protein